MFSTANLINLVPDTNFSIFPIYIGQIFARGAIKEVLFTYRLVDYLLQPGSSLHCRP